MRTAGLLLFLFPALLFTSSLRWRTGSPSASSFDLAWNSPATTLIKKAAAQQLATNDYAAAAETFARGAQGALRQGDQATAARFAFNRASTLMAVGRFREALATYQQARKYSEASGDEQTSRALHFALANLYMAFGDRTAAAVAARHGLDTLTQASNLAVRLPLLLILARLEVRERGIDRAMPLFQEAIAAAQNLDASPDAGTQSREAEAWDSLGYEQLQVQNIVAAEDAFARAWWRRTLQKDPRLAQSYPLLAGVFFAQKDLARANLWSERSLSNAASLRLLMPWTLFHRQGRIAEGMGDLRGAFTAYRKALEDARRWRTGLIPADRFRTHAEVQISDLFDDFIRVATALPQTASLGRETFDALQESHAWSLQAELESSANISDRLPEEYAAELAAVRRLEGQLLAGPNSILRAEADIRRVKLLEMEAAAGMPAQVSGRAQFPREQLSPDEAVLTFHTAEPVSRMWLLTASGLRSSTLPGRAALAAAAHGFRQAVESDSPRLRADGERLLAMLLGDLRQPALALHNWRLVLDDGLFDIPFAALSVNGREYLVEEHTVLQVPNLGVSAASEPLSGTLLGVADPIFSRADRRSSKTTSSLWSPAAGMELSRLPASSLEARQSLSAWGSGRLLTGAEASLDQLQTALRRERPAVLHLATHAIPLGAAGTPEAVGLALSLGADGQMRFFGQRDITALPSAPALVVMSACQSGQGEQRPGAGVVGLTRAWLAAGSQNVVATYWPTLDDAGPLFTNFYRHVASHKIRGRFAVADALHQSQRACLRSNSYQSQPRYWAGFFASGKG